MKMKRKLLTTALVAMLVGALVEAAPQLQPPSEFMKQDRYNSAVVKIARVTEDGRFELEVIEQLYGETSDGLVVRVSGGDTQWIEVGKTYVIGHTDKPARRSPRWDTDPAGPRILAVPTVGLAVLENSAAMRALVRARPEDAPLTDRERLDAVLEQLASEDVLSRRFVLAELALVPALRELVGADELALLKKTVESGTLEPLALEYMLRASLPMLDSWGGDWLAVSCRKVAEENGPELDLTSPIPSLLVVSFEMLERTGEPSDAKLAQKHVGSNNPGVGKAAFKAMLALDRELAAKAAPGILENRDLHPDTRRFIQSLAAGPAPSAGAE